jgi:hypothetical protein
MHSSIRPAAILLLVLVALILPASATVISVSPDVVQKGGQITVDISDLRDGQTFSLSIDGTSALVPGSYSTTDGTLIFSTNNFNIPFSLNQGTVSATTRGTSYTEFSVKPRSGKSYSVGGDPDPSGYFTVSEQQSVASGMYDFLKLSGVIMPGTTQLKTQMNLLGTKQGPANSQITFNIGGLDNGEVTITAFVDGNQVLAPKTVVIGNGVPVATQPPTPEPTTSVTTTTTTSAQSTGTGTTTAATSTTEPSTTTYSKIIDTTAAPQSTTYYSADRKVSLNGQGIGYATVMMVGETPVPSDWLLINNAYVVAPDTLTFSPPATLSFTTPSGKDYAYFVGRRVNNEWSVVPTNAGPGTIIAIVDRAGTYGLMAYKPESSVQPTVTGDGQQPAPTTPTPLVKSTDAPKVASIAKAATEPGAAAASKGAPVDFAIIAGALVIGVVAFVAWKR